MALDSEKFKQVLGCWATGVTIVTAKHQDEIHGMTVSACSEVSLDPPLVLVCADRSSDTHGVIARGEVFAVNLLAAGQHDLSNRFARSKDEHLRFEGLERKQGATGCPHIPDALATLDCRVVQAVEAGDHVIYIGRVEAAEALDHEPLLYFRGRYGRFHAPGGEPGPNPGSGVSPSTSS